MVSPSTPWPRASKYDDALSEIIASGDIAQARDYFDKVFWENQSDRPGWKHLRQAVLREDQAMVRILVTWGAHPTTDEMAQFRSLAGEKYPDYLKLLRQAGLRANGQPWEEIVPKAPAQETDDDRNARAIIDGRADDHRMKLIPAEWLQVLKAFQLNGSNEAVIAGGALRDLFNAREIKDVDIFLRSQGSEKKNRKYLEAVFAASGVQVHDQQIRYSDGYGSISRPEKFPKPASTRGAFNDAAVKRERYLESWKIIAGPQQTEYNVIFVDDTLDKKLTKDVNKFDAKSIFVGALLDAFDTGLSQIATDGTEVVSTQAYKDDVRLKRISLLRPNESSNDHLKRVVKKYPDFEQTPEVVARLKPAPARPHRGISVWY